ncbi:kinesin motor domain protein, partial [Teladorsagia circumcincta]
GKMTNPPKKVDKINVRVAVRVSYGQTGTGKTYTMEGGSSDRSSYKHDPTTGLIPRAVEHIFEELEKSNTEEYSVRVSYLELYNEELYDLLAPTTDDRERLRIFDDPSRKGMVVISGAEELPVKDRSEVYTLLKRGAEKRTTAATLMNMSSRNQSTLAIFIEDQELMDEQYRELYHRNKRLEAKLRQRVDELDGTRKELSVTTERLHTLDRAFQEVHNLATQLYMRLKETRETVFDQQLDLEDWWAKEAILSNLIAQNKQVVVAARAKVMAEVTSCCSAISEFLEKGVERREAVNKSIESGLSTVGNSLSGCMDSTSNGIDELRKWVEDCEELCRTVVPKIIALSDGSSLFIEEKLNKQIEEFGVMNTDVSQLLSTVKGETLKLSQTLEELRRDSDLMITELAQSIVAECLQYQTENQETLQLMEYEDNDFLKRNLSEIETWGSTFQGRGDAAHQAIAWANETVDKTLETVTDRMSCSADVLKETCMRAKEANVSLAETANCFGEEVTARSRYISRNVTDLLNSIRERTGTIETTVAENENIRKTEQVNQATFDHTVAQGLRDRLGEESVSLSGRPGYEESKADLEN